MPTQKKLFSSRVLIAESLPMIISFFLVGAALTATPAAAVGIRGEPIPDFVASPAYQAPAPARMYLDLGVRPRETPVIVLGSPFSDPAAGPVTPQSVRRYVESLSARRM